MYFLMCFLVRVFGTITGKITTEYLTPGYYRLVTGVKGTSNELSGRSCSTRVQTLIDALTLCSVQGLEVIRFTSREARSWAKINGSLC